MIIDWPSASLPLSRTARCAAPAPQVDRFEASRQDDEPFRPARGALGFAASPTDAETCATESDATRGTAPAGAKTASAAGARPSVAALLKAGLVAATGVPLGGTPLSVTLQSLQWPEPALREAEAHRAAVGLGACASLGELARTELERAQSLDPRVQEADMARAIEMAEQAQQLEPVSQDDLFAFSRLVDAKFPLTPERIEALGRSLEARYGSDEVREALSGVPCKHPDLSTFARVVGHLEKGNGASLQISMDQATTDWLLGEVPGFQESMGGAGGFGANAAARQPNVTVSFWNLGDLPPGVGKRFRPDVTILDEQGRARPAEQATDPGLGERINYVAEYDAPGQFTLQGRNIPISGSGRVILSSPGTQEIGFGHAGDQTLRSAIAGKKLFFFAGTHYLTKEPHPQTEELARDLAVMKAANPECLFHLQYVVPKDPKQEVRVLDTLMPYTDSMSLNAVEVPALRSRLRGEEVVQLPRKQVEEPELMLAEALEIKSRLGLQRLHFHGMDGDLMVTSTPKDHRRQVLSLFRARQLASMKATNPSGEVKDEHEMWPVLPLVEGSGLAAVQKFADAVQARFGLSAEQRRAITRDYYYDDPASGQTIFFVPSRGIHDRTGGTVSLGDTTDVTAVVYGLEDGVRTAN